MELHTTSPIDTRDRVLPEQLILDRLREDRRITVEAVGALVPELSWAQLFLAIDRLSRRGSVELRRQGFTYTVRRAEAFVKGAGGVDGAAHQDHR
jgi:hypothetical protein